MICVTQPACSLLFLAETPATEKSLVVEGKLQSSAARSLPWVSEAVLVTRCFPVLSRISAPGVVQLCVPPSGRASLCPVPWLQSSRVSSSAPTQALPSELCWARRGQGRCPRCCSTGSLHRVCSRCLLHGHRREATGHCWVPPVPAAPPASTGCRQGLGTWPLLLLGHNSAA